MSMDEKVIDGLIFRQILQSGFHFLSQHFQEINDLNVFPVPDGDTGTNMRLTFLSGLEHIKESENISLVADDFASGMLLGARGNSGVLSSRYFYGLSKGFLGKKEVSVKDFAVAMKEAYQASYHAVDEPTEGTILTVAREGIETIFDTIDFDSITFFSFFSMVVEAMKISLDKTPSLLPILRESGVVDSGGKGLLVIFQGFMKFFDQDKDDMVMEEYHESPSLLPKYDFSLFDENSVLEYGYCTEFLLQLQTCKIDIHDFNLNSFIAYLHEHGNSIVCFQNGSIVKVHIHTKKPYEVIEYAQRFGEFLTFKMENMTLQNKNVREKKEEQKLSRKKFAVVSIGQGAGILKLFRDLGSDVVIDGGKTMNTSSEEILSALKKANAEETIVLPNDKNILLAAMQAKELYQDGKVRVLETKSIPAGYACLSMMMGDEESAEDCYKSMEEENGWVKTGFICKSVRDTSVDGISCIKGNYIEGVDGHLVGCESAMEDAIDDLLRHIPDIKEKETLFLFYGKNITKEAADEIKNRISKEYPNLEIGLLNGGQDVYDILIGVN